ncbi:FYVE zinc finger-domain-containing protein [Bisporella sp. PMI_857]|nr:FYVE zinc finger-domain-containing protein [Bisporella sp. PMI_857]
MSGTVNVDSNSISSHRDESRIMRGLELPVGTPIHSSTGSEQLRSEPFGIGSGDDSASHTSPPLVRDPSSSSISSLRRRRREEKQPEDPHLSRNPLGRSGSSVALPHNDAMDELSDTESLDGRRVRTKYGHKLPLVPSRTPSSGSQNDGRGSSDIAYERRTYPTGNTTPHESSGGEWNFPARNSERQSIDFGPRVLDTSRPPPPPPKSRDQARSARTRVDRQMTNPDDQDISLSQALQLEDPRNHVEAQQPANNAYPQNVQGRSWGPSNSSSPQRTVPIPSRGVLSPLPHLPVRQNSVVLPRWQPDAEVTLCPICRTQFSFFVRKHHCRKCGRVVCNACSPHRITIPYQFIVQPPSSESSTANPYYRPSLDPAHAASEYASLGGGERVRLCNPCVPDPNLAPPQTPETPHRPSNLSAHSRSVSLATPQSSAVHIGSSRHYSREQGNRNSRAQSTTSSSQPNASHLQNVGHQHTTSRGRSSTTNVQPHYRSLIPADESRPLPRPPRIAEEDECPVCHQELPSSALPSSEILREQHINRCIENAFSATPAITPAPPALQRRSSHATSAASTSAPRPIPNTPEGRMAAREEAHAAVIRAATSPPRAYRHTGMIPYKATEKDCVDDAECTICLEEFEVGNEMGRLECFCRFHLHCIRSWFETHPGQCPVHQHGGGY